MLKGVTLNNGTAVGVKVFELKRDDGYCLSTMVGCKTQRLTCPFLNLQIYTFEHHFTSLFLFLSQLGLVECNLDRYVHLIFLVLHIGRKFHWGTNSLSLFIKFDVVADAFGCSRSKV